MRNGSGSGNCRRRVVLLWAWGLGWCLGFWRLGFVLGFGLWRFRLSRSLCEWGRQRGGNGKAMARARARAIAREAKAKARSPKAKRHMAWNNCEALQLWAPVCRLLSSSSSLAWPPGAGDLYSVGSSARRQIRHGSSEPLGRKED